MSNKFGIFLAGGAIGAIAALLYAPRAGVETRAMVADKANELWGTAQHYGNEAQVRGQQFYSDARARGEQTYQTVSDNARTAYGKASGAAQGAYENASARVQTARDNVKPVFTEKNDELREKIEAARARISSQVIKNAEETQAAADQGVAEVEAEVNEPAAEEAPAEAPAEEAEKAEE